MKAEIRPRIELRNRESLEHAIPLSTPWVIFVDPSDACNFRCSFCPSSNVSLLKSVGRSLKVMDYLLYEKVVDDICEFDKPIKVLRLYKDGEPLMNPKFAKMVKYAKESGCCERVDTTTNASLLNPKLNLEIIEAGLDRINISIEGVNAEQYLRLSNYKINFEKLVENITHFYDNRNGCDMVVKINGDIINHNDCVKFYEIFGDITDGIFIEHAMNCWSGFEMEGVVQNEIYGIYGQPIKEVLVCPYPFYSFSINSDGNVSLCFLDWARNLIIGHVAVQSVKEIWNGKPIKDYRKLFLNKNRKKHKICRNCSQLSHGMPVNLDKHAYELLKRYEK